MNWAQASALALLAASVTTASEAATANSRTTAVAKAGYTTPSPAGYVYRRVGTPMPAEAPTTAPIAAVTVDADDVTGLDVTAPRRARTGPSGVGAMGDATSSRGAMSAGVGVNAPGLPSSNRQGGN